MKIKITYEYDPKFSNKFWAKSGEFCRSGETWEEARYNLIEMIRLAAQTIVVPKDEEVEVEI